MRKDRTKKRCWVQKSISQESKRLIVRHSRNRHPHICDYYIRNHGFSDLCRLPRDSASKSKAAHFKDLIVDFFYVLRNFRYLYEAQQIIAIGTMAFNIALFLKLGLLSKSRRVFWFGLFIHSPRWLRIARRVFRILDSKKMQYVLFSNFEKKLYAEALLLDENRMFYVPYGDLSEQKIPLDAEINVENKLEETKFFFSGGYSNRDYLILIKVFRALPYNLIIICSRLNTEVDESSLPPNIKVLRELSSESFDAYIRASKACIIPIASNTGAAGQSCLLRYMKNRKIIIATDTGIIREYITDGVSGILVKDNHESMANAVIAVATKAESYQSYADSAYENFIKNFSGEAIMRKLDEIIDKIT